MDFMPRNTVILGLNGVMRLIWCSKPELKELLEAIKRGEVDFEGYFYGARGKNGIKPNIKEAGA